MELKTPLDFLEQPGLLLLRITAGLLASALWILSFPGHNLDWLAWIVLVPLILACRGLNAPAAGAVGLISGFVSTFGVFYWMFEVPGFRVYHMLLGASFFGLYPAVWCAGTRLLKQSRLPALITWPSLWIALDYLKAHAGFLAFSWGTLAQSQYQHPATLQIAAYTGEYGLTCLIVMANVAIADWISEGRKVRTEVVVTGALITLAHLWGFYELSFDPSVPSLRVAVVQPSILRAERESLDGHTACLERLEHLTIKAARYRPSLIAWPETAVQDPTKDPNLIRRLNQLSRETQTPLIVGASDFIKFQYPGKAVFERRQYNSAYFIEPGNPPTTPYRKHILLPFGEYLPLESIVSWPTWFVPRLFYVLPGEGPKNFQLPDGHRFSVIICWENLFASYVRQMVHNGAQVVVHLANDNWFGPTAAPLQHNAASVLRAVENRTPIMVASNTGPSEIIDPYGRIKARQTGLFTQGVVAAEIQLNARQTFYTRFGDLFTFGAMTVLLIGAISALCKFKSKRD